MRQQSPMMGAAGIRVRAASHDEIQSAWRAWSLPIVTPRGELNSVVEFSLETWYNIIIEKLYRP